MSAEPLGSEADPNAEATLQVDAFEDERPIELERGAAVGRYVVLGKAGQGGMGIVYAGYDEELHRRVAIKVLKARTASAASQGWTQLLGEARAIAQLSHPNIVHVYEVGVHEGDLFMAMEWIEGRTLSKWLRDEPAPAQVIAMFVAAGRGLVAAHEAGLVHRDFKPENVLVGDDGRPRVLDFGLARFDPSARNSTTSPFPSSDDVILPATDDGYAMGTPPYMAPEQHAGESIGPATDQYAFCVSLWQGLTGSRPFRAKRMGELIAQKKALDLQPPKDGRRRGLTPRLERILRRGLDPDPAARWPSMDALLILLAADPSRTRKRIAAGVGVMGLLGLAAWGTLRPAPSPCAGVESQLDDTWGTTRRNATLDGLRAVDVPFAEDTARAVGDVLDGYAGRWVEMYRDACEARHVRGSQSDRILDLRMQCLARAETRLDALAEILGGADAEVAEHALEAAYSLPAVAACADLDALQAAVAPPDDEQTRARVAEIRRQIDRAATLGSTQRVSQMRAIAGEVYAAAMETGYAPVQAEALDLRASTKRHDSDFEGAIDDYLQAARYAAAGGDVAAEADLWNSLFFVAGYLQHQHERAIAWMAATDAVLARLGDEHTTERAARYVNAALVLGDANRYEEAEQAGRRGIEILEAAGAKPLTLATAYENLVLVLIERNHPEEAERLQRQVLEIRRKALGEHHPEVARAEVNLSILLAQHGRGAEAIPILRDAVRIFEGTYGPSSSQVATSLNNLASVLQNLGEHEEAATLLERALAIREQRLGPDDPSVADPLNNLAILALERGDLQKADQYATRSYDVMSKLGADHPRLGIPISTLADIAARRGDFEKALELNRRAAKLFLGFGESHPFLGFVLTAEGVALVELGRADEAIAPLERALAIRQEAGAEAPHRAETQYHLARALLASDRARALELARTAADTFAASGEQYAEAHAEAEAFLRDPTVPGPPS